MLLIVYFCINKYLKFTARICIGFQVQEDGSNTMNYNGVLHYFLLHFQTDFILWLILLHNIIYINFAAWHLYTFHHNICTCHFMDLVEIVWISVNYFKEFKLAQPINSNFILKFEMLFKLILIRNLVGIDITQQYWKPINVHKCSFIGCRNRNCILHYFHSIFKVICSL